MKYCIIILILRYFRTINSNILLPNWVTGYKEENAMTCKQLMAVQTLPDDVWEQFEAEVSGETARLEAQRRQSDPEYQRMIDEEVKNILAVTKTRRKFDRIIGIVGNIIFTLWTLLSCGLWLFYVLNGGTDWSLYMFFVGPILGFAGIILSSFCLVKSKIA